MEGVGADVPDLLHVAAVAGERGSVRERQILVVCDNPRRLGSVGPDTNVSEGARGEIIVILARYRLTDEGKVGIGGLLFGFTVDHANGNGGIGVKAHHAEHLAAKVVELTLGGVHHLDGLDGLVGEGEDRGIVLGGGISIPGAHGDGAAGQMVADPGTVGDQGLGVDGGAAKKCFPVKRRGAFRRSCAGKSKNFFPAGTCVQRRKRTFASCAVRVPLMPHMRHKGVPERPASGKQKKIY